LTSQPQPLEARPDRSGGHPSETAGEGFPLNFQPRRGKEMQAARGVALQRVSARSFPINGLLARALIGMGSCEPVAWA